MDSQHSMEQANKQRRKRSTCSDSVLQNTAGQVTEMVVEGVSTVAHGVRGRMRLASSAKIVFLSVMSTLMVLVCTSLTVANNYLAIYDGNNVLYRYTPYKELEDILEEQEIELGEYDDLAFSGFDAENRATLVIRRAFDVSVTADGETRTVTVTDGTVADILKKVEVTYGSDDLVNVALTEKVNENTHIKINRVTYEETVEVEEVAFETVSPEGDCPSDHHEETVTNGKKGERTIVTQTRYVDGEETEAVVVSDEVTKEPVNKVVEYKENISPGVSTLVYDSSILQLDDNGNPINYKYKVTGKATAYSALGRPTKLVPGCVAMDLSKYPRGTMLYVKTPDGSYVYGYSRVADTGSFVSNGSGVLIDLFFNTYAESVRFGAKTVDVYVLT